MTLRRLLNKTSGALLCVWTYPLMTLMSMVINLVILPFRALAQMFSMGAKNFLRIDFGEDIRTTLALLAINYMGFLIYNLVLYFLENNPLKLLTAPFTGLTLGWQDGLEAFIEHENIDFLNVIFGAIFCTALYPVLTLIDFLIKLPYHFISALYDTKSSLVEHSYSWPLVLLLTPFVGITHFFAKILNFIFAALLPSPLAGLYEGSIQGMGALLHHPDIKALYDYCRPDFPLPRFNIERNRAEREAQDQNIQQRQERMAERMAEVGPRNIFIPMNGRAREVDYARANAQLLGKIASLEENPKKADFLRADEINEFKRLIEQDKDPVSQNVAQKKLNTYQSLLADNVCPISYGELHEIDEPITVRRGNSWTHIYEKSYLETHIRTENDSRRQCAMDVVTRQNLTENLVTYTQGIPGELVDELNPTLKEVREALVLRRIKPAPGPAANQASLFAGLRNRVSGRQVLEQEIRLEM